MTDYECNICNDDRTCACWRCIECEQSFTEDTAFTYDAEWERLCPTCAAYNLTAAK